MNEPSKREFIKSCFCVAASGLGYALLGPLCSCGQRPANGPARAGSSGNKTTSTGGDAGTAPASPPAYLALHDSGELKRRGEHLWSLMSDCSLCPRECGADRLAGERGFCQSSSELEIASHHPHFGEERSLVGDGGSGTVFFSNCGLRCVFCINWEISQGGQGSTASIDDLAGMMLRLQEIGCHNINVVTPTHYSAHILLALDRAAARGLTLPLVYNTCGWERVEILEVLDGVVDIYLPDFKYADGAMAAKYSSEAESYPEETKTALLEMQRQVGVARPASDGLMYRGLMIRHLVMPNGVSGTKQVIDWIAANLPKETYFNLMSQYRPTFKAFDYPEIARKLEREEYVETVQYARDAGLTNLDVQGWWW
jgi:putative pyruvate formate lyase activating enzyme